MCGVRSSGRARRLPRQTPAAELRDAPQTRQMFEPNLHRQAPLGLECIRTSWRIRADREPVGRPPARPLGSVRDVTTAPILLCDDGSEPARRAIAAAGDLFGGGPALVVTVWEPYKPGVLQAVGGTVALASGLAKDFDKAALRMATECATAGVDAAAAAGF